MKHDLTYLNMSDIHLGRKNNPTERIISNLYRYFKKYHNKFKTLDMINLNGDIYDRLLTHGSNEAVMITSWLTWLARYCLTYDITLRILEGTPSHDWKQIRAFDKFIADSKEFKDLDFKYVDCLTIEHIDKFDIDILYVPDEWRVNPNDTLLEVHKLLKDNHLDKVDIALMHGNFNYQLPPHIGVTGHIEKDYLDIVRHYIHIGHIHKFSTYNRILANGSFDRLAHGEEENKGCILATVECNGKREYTFLPVEQTYIFDTIEVDMSINDLKILLRKKYGLNQVVNIRLRTSDSDIGNIINSLKLAFPRILFTSDKIKTKEVKEEDVFKDISTVVEITSHNITPSILERINTEDITPLLLKELESAI